MALTVIPAKDFDALMKGVSEDSSSKHPFSYKDMKKSHSMTYYEILNYMETTDVKQIGTGSARTAFFMPPGSVPKDKSAPSCFKVAKSMRGVAQNEAEIKIFKQYGRKRPCFPEMFDYDSISQYYLFTEVGKPVRDNDLIGWFADWNKILKDTFHIDDENGYDAIEDITIVCEKMTKFDKGDANSILKEIRSDLKNQPKYDGLLSLIEFAVDGGMNTVDFGDFGNNISNWAFVVRDKIETLIPIDFGFTWEVSSKYYTNG